MQDKAKAAVKSDRNLKIIADFQNKSSGSDSLEASSCQSKRASKRIYDASEEQPTKTPTDGKGANGPPKLRKAKTSASDTLTVNEVTEVIILPFFLSIKDYFGCTNFVSYLYVFSPFRK